MKILWAQGKIDVDRGLEAVGECEAEFEADPWLANAQSIANYVLPRESNGFEGYLRFPIPREDDDASDEKSELRIYFSPRAMQPYRIVFVHRTSEGLVGFDVFSQLWAHRIAVQLEGTGVLKREIPKPVYGNEPLED
jgi:hypothetical protein